MSFRAVLSFNEKRDIHVRVDFRKKPMVVLLFICFWIISRTKFESNSNVRRKSLSIRKDKTVIPSLNARRLAPIFKTLLVKSRSCGGSSGQSSWPQSTNDSPCHMHIKEADYVCGLTNF